MHTLGTPVLVAGALTRLDRPEAHGVESTLDRGRRDEPATVLEAELGPPLGVEVSSSLYSVVASSREAGRLEVVMELSPP